MKSIRMRSEYIRCKNLFTKLKTLSLSRDKNHNEDTHNLSNLQAFPQTSALPLFSFSSQLLELQNKKVLAT
jgi:hypothetical protein